MLIDEIIRAIIQIFVISIIPFLIWFFSSRKKETFFSWIGLKKINVFETKKYIIVIIIAFVITAMMSFVLDPLLPNNLQLANARFEGKGISVLPGVIVFSLFATALPEEMLFRGLLGKQLGKKIGFISANTIQSLIFGLLHGISLFGVLSIELPLLIIAFTTSLGWAMGYINQKTDGSILTSVIIHAISNVYACVIIMFSIW